MKMVTSLSFQGQCREAFDFYAKVLGGKTASRLEAKAGLSAQFDGERHD